MKDETGFSHPSTLNSHQQLTVQGYPLRPIFGVNKTLEGAQYLCAWRNGSEELPDHWLRVIVCDVFRKLLIANTPGRPSAEFVTGAAELMVEVVGEGMTETLDGERVKQGFKLLFRTLNKWPQPADVLKVLPRRPSPKTSEVFKTSEVCTTVEGHALAADALDKIMDMLEKGGENE
jgi:hypothetical protein